MTIWKVPFTLEQINQMNQDTMVTHLGIIVTEIGDDYIKATMPVDHRTRQPMGLLHGGASVVLAETIGSIAANLAVGPSHYCVGLEINANHVRSVKKGLVTGLCRPVHIGQSTHVWDIRITDGNGHTSCVSRLTMAVIKA